MMRVPEIMERKCPMEVSDRRFEDLPDLIQALGCTLTTTWTRAEVVGAPPDDAACLLTGGRVGHRGALTLNVLLYVTHEAIHHFHGPKGIKEELTMMALEYALYGMLRNDEHRHAAFDFFSDTYDEKDSVGEGIREHGAAYFTSERWEYVLEAGQPWVTKTGRVRAKIMKRLG